MKTLTLDVSGKTAAHDIDRLQVSAGSDDDVNYHVNLYVHVEEGSDAWPVLIALDPDSALGLAASLEHMAQFAKGETTQQPSGQ